MTPPATHSANQQDLYALSPMDCISTVHSYRLIFQVVHIISERWRCFNLRLSFNSLLCGDGSTVDVTKRQLKYGTHKLEETASA